MKAETEEAAETKQGYQNYGDWIDLHLYTNPMEMELRQGHASVRM